MNPQERSLVTAVVRDVFDELYSLRNEVEVLRRSAETHREDLATLLKTMTRAPFECVEAVVDQAELLTLPTERERSQYIINQLVKTIAQCKPLLGIRRNPTDDGLRAYCFVARLP